MNNLELRAKVLSASKVGIEFEFYSELKAKEITRSLSAYLQKKVVIPITVKDFGKEEKGTYHSDLEPTATMFKLEKDFSGGHDMYELITGPIPYNEARIVLIKMLLWIKDKGWTDSKCAIHLNLSFNYFSIKLKTPLMAMNVLKFILGFEESIVYTRFPNREDSVYAKSINNIYPLNRFIFYDTPDYVDRNLYHVPNEKYFGVNFTKLPKDYLEFRYLGGEGYENRTQKILDLMDYFVIRMYNTIQTADEYTPQEKDKLHSILKVQKKAVATFSDPAKFFASYPNIAITVDLKGDVEIIKAYWTVIREKLFELIVESGMKKGHLNLDTDVSMFQLRGATMKKANDVNDLELFDCIISGTINRCSLYRCEIDSSRLDQCKLMEENMIKDSKVEHTSLYPGNELQNCYINNPKEIVDCKVTGGVLRKGVVGKHAEISETTLIVDSKMKDDGKDTHQNTPFQPNQK